MVTPRNKGKRKNWSTKHQQADKSRPKIDDSTTERNLWLDTV